MESGRRACWTQLWLLTFLTFFSQASLSDGTPLQVLSAPNLLRVGTAENIFVECQDCTGGSITVEIKVMNYPTKSEMLASTTVTLTEHNNFQHFGELTVPPVSFSKDLSMNQYVYLQALFPGRVLEKVVLVSFQSGYIFIQTDKLMYSPGSKVLYRIFGVTPKMLPVERSYASSPGITVEIMNPEGYILEHHHVSSFLSDSFYLSKTASHGLWKVMAKFRSNPQKNFSVEFEVKDYVLPSFEVKLTTDAHLFHVGDQMLTVHIEAMYLPGEAVEGMAYAVFGIIHNGLRKTFSTSFQSVSIVGGHGEATLLSEHITQRFQNLLHLVGAQIYVTVTVQAENGGEMVEARLNGIKIVRSPYTINFKKTSKYYKPGLSFDVMVEVLNQDDTPARGVELVLDPGHIQMRTSNNGIARIPINTMPFAGPLTITARTNYHHISRGEQATQTMVAFPHKSKSNSYIHIDVDNVEAELGGVSRFIIYVPPATYGSLQCDITYLILSRGQLVSFGRHHSSHQIAIAMQLPVTKEMMPSFRIIAYYHTNGEVVSDSVWVDVKDSCMGSLKLEEIRRHYHRPRSALDLRVTGDPGAKVVLVARDKNLPTINNRNHLTQKKLWDIVEKYDTGCTPGGGEDSMGVFYDAGLLFESSVTGTPYRTDPKCPGHSRWKRASGVLHSATSLEELEDDLYFYSEEIMSRSFFPESWLWIDASLPNCPDYFNCDTTSFQKHFAFPDSITTWQLSAISLSETHGICVADPLEVTVKKIFSIDLKLPFSAVQGKQLEIKAILHNYNPDPLHVRVDLLENEHLCSAASMRGKYRQQISVWAGATRSVPFIIVPTKHGEFVIAVKAAVKGSDQVDGIMKKLLVVPHGAPAKSLKTVTLNPAKKGGIQEETLNSNIRRKYMIPKTSSMTEIFVTVKQSKEAQQENYISGHSMGSLIKPPEKDFTQSFVSSMALLVSATTYLDKTNQWEAVGFEKRDNALEYIKSGYIDALTAQTSDGAFETRIVILSPVLRIPGTLLTEDVIRLLTMASSLVNIQSKVICDAVRYLITRAQEPDGMFPSNVVYTDSDASRTALCLIAIEESLSLCLPIVDNTEMLAGFSQARRYLERNLLSLTNPRAVAMASYALAYGNRLNKKILYKFASKDLTHWPTSEGHATTVETTAYALLALVKANAFEEARPVVKWLSQQKRENGQYGSEQATLMVYQAVAEYWTTVKEQDNDLTVDILLPGRSRRDTFLFNGRQPTMRRITRVSGINKDIQVTATGTGEATLTMVSQYYTHPGEKERDCKNLQLLVKLLPERSGVGDNVYLLKIEALSMTKDVEFTNLVLEVGLLSGFTGNDRDLNLLLRSKTVRKFEMTPLSDSIIIHLNQLSSRQPEEIAFRIREQLKLKVLQPAAVSIYEHNKREPSCVKFYHPERKNGELPRHCANGECTCPAVLDDCSMQRNKALSNMERRTITGIDYAYKITLDYSREEISTDGFTARIQEVITAGNIDIDPQGEWRAFVSPPYCREALHLRPGGDFLIMGASKDIQKLSHNASYQYVLGENTWFEPLPVECYTERNRHTCLDLQKLERQYKAFKCQQ